MIQNFRRNIILVLQGLIFILPLFFLPITASRLGIDNFNKLYLLIIVVPLMILFFLALELYKGQIKIKYNSIDLYILIFLSVSLMSAVFALDKFSAFFGAYNIGLPFFGLLALVLLYFLVKNFLNYGNIIKILKLILLGFFIIISVAFILLLVLRFGLIGENNFFVSAFNFAIGTLEDLSIYISIISVFILGILNSGNIPAFYTKKWQIIFLKIVFIISLLFLAITNFSPAWLTFLAGTIFIFAINYFNAKKNIILPAVLIFIGLSFLLLNFLSNDNSSINRMTSKLQMDHKNTFSLSISSLKTRPVFGYGQETFNYAFSKFRNVDLNNTGYWYLRFNNPYSYVSGLIIQEGMIGFLSYLALLFFIAKSIIKSQKKTRTNNNLFKNENVILFSLSAGLISAMIGQFFYFFNITLFLIFWLFLALFYICYNIILQSEIKEVVINKNAETKYFNIFKTVVIFGFFGWAVLTGYDIKYFIAEAKSRNDIDENSLIRSVQLNPARYNYRINLSKYYLEKALTEIKKTGSQKDFKAIEENINKSIDQARTATVIAPYSVNAFESLGLIYGQLGSYAKDTDGMAINAFNKAWQLEPTNPVLATELGKSYLGNGQTDLAVETLQKAINLKSDYNDAKLYLAKAYIQNNKYNEALEILKSFSEVSDSPEVSYEIGQIYFNQKKYDRALDEFKKVITILPNHANALYALGLSYEKLGDKKSALYYYKKVLALNPGNMDLVKKIGELSKIKN